MKATLKCSKPYSETTSRKVYLEHFDVISNAVNVQSHSESKVESQFLKPSVSRSSIPFLFFHRRFEKSGIQCIYVKSTVGRILSYHCQFIILLFCIYDLEVHSKRT